MRPAIRAALTAAAIVVIGAVALAVRSLTAFGVFTDVEPGFAGVCKPITGVIGPEDIVIDDKSQLAFISATDRRALKAGQPAKQDGLYVFNLKTQTLTKLTGTPDDFHPHGISVIRASDGQLVLMAINDRAKGGSSIEMFAVKADGNTMALSNIGSVESDELVSPNAVAAVDGDHFYVVNDHTSKTPFGRMLDDDLVLPRANVVYFNGMIFRPVATGLNFPNGAVVSPDGKYLYVSESYNRRLTTYAIGQASGSLDIVNQMSIPSNLDNLRLDAAGNLWIGSHPKAFAMAAYRSDASKPAPSQIFKVTLVNGIPQSAVPVYTNPGSEIGASSVAAVSGQTLLIGSPFDTKILSCTMDR